MQRETKNVKAVHDNRNTEMKTSGCIHSTQNNTSGCVATQVQSYILLVFGEMLWESFHRAK